MIFISLLILSTFAIAGSAAYFSVYGLANTFSGVFWSVVVMGASLEAGKLIAASYLYRYWNKTGLLLKSYLIAGIAALMLLTSGGIFGYLSSGYQQDVLPLKQAETQVKLLEEEKTRKLERKKQIDDEIIKLPSINVGNIDLQNAQSTSAATRALRETRRIRDDALKNYRAEQNEVTKRITELDQQVLELKQQLIKTEAHIGPITYIAKAFNVETDDATKWLVLLIIFAFDPMAVALTLAVNIALKIRRDEKTKPEETKNNDIQFIPVTASTSFDDSPFPPYKDDHVEDTPVVRPLPEPMPPEPSPSKIVDEDKDPPKPPPPPPPPPTLELVEGATVRTPRIAPKRHTRPYPGRLEGISASEKIDEILSHYRFLCEKEQEGTLTDDERWDKQSIKAFLDKKGLSIYLD